MADFQREAFLVFMMIWCGCGLLFIIAAFIIGIPSRIPPPAMLPPIPKPPRREVAPPDQEPQA